MLEVTQKAAQALKEIRGAHATEEEEALRLAGSPGEGFGLVLDKERDGDEVVQVENERVLVMDKDTLTTLDGATLDCVDTPEGVRLTLRR